VFWPDFGEQALLNALLDFQGRKRRFGGVDSTS
jgi:undecaprenyl diphosphate synthase